MSQGAMVPGRALPPPPVNRSTDTCENITFKQLHWRAVNTDFFDLATERATKYGQTNGNQVYIHQVRKIGLVESL